MSTSSELVKKQARIQLSKVQHSSAEQLFTWKGQGHLHPQEGTQFYRVQLGYPKHLERQLNGKSSIEKGVICRSLRPWREKAANRDP